MKGFEWRDNQSDFLILKIFIAVFTHYIENNKLNKCDSSFA